MASNLARIGPFQVNTALARRFTKLAILAVKNAISSGSKEHCSTEQPFSLVPLTSPEFTRVADK